MSGERLLLLVTVRTFLDVRAQLPLALELGAARLAVVDGVQRVVRHVHAQLMVEAELLATLGALVLAAAVLALVVLPAQVSQCTHTHTCLHVHWPLTNVHVYMY